MSNPNKYSIKLQGSHALWKTWKMRKLISKPGKALENNEMSWKNPGHSLKIHTKLELSIFLEDLEDLYHMLFSWKILILTLKSPGKMDVKKCGNPELFRCLSVLKLVMIKNVKL